VSAGVITRTSVPRPINIDDFEGPTRTTTCTAPFGTCTVGGIPTTAFACHSTGNSEDPVFPTQIQSPQWG
jgi:predicted CxxxxCH...CXXCH cytochrome family protein